MSLFKRKDSPYWWVKLTPRSGPAIQRSTGTADKVAAQEYHDMLKASLWQQERLGVKPKRSWREAVVRWLEETSEKATHKEDKRKLVWLHAYLGSLNLDEITMDVIDRIRSARLKEGSKGTCNRYLALVRSILLRARDEWEWIDKVPKVRLFKEANNRERSLTPEQARSLLQELPEHQRDCVLFALATGLRQSNVLKLEWAQVNLELRHAWVKGTQSKNRRPIAVPLSETAMDVLKRQIGRHPQRVFTFRGRPINSANTKAWRAALMRAGIEDFRWHDLRHTWATWQRQAGTPTHELQRLGGWRTGAMVERYAHLAPDHLAAAASRLDSVLVDAATL
ncbi:integrase [Paraburkholderia aromaticivorans]|uniref:Integrase n=2 Tax=Paraburkholderia aromaticivorans TaxID=2026199 RepID=A0A248VF73_9BURK|nr:integrase [Paraburkholderia aromaticivorans]